MKPIALLLLAFTAATAHAGSFGGPPPFTNGSPLQSGVNGAYQASARGSNLSGVITFTYSGGVQSTSFTGNTWVIFYQGQVYSGSTDAAINDSNISGVLETSFTSPVSQGTSSTNTTTGTVLALPDVVNTSTQTQTSSDTLTALSNPSGFFNAKLDTNSPTGSFKGNGVLAAVFTRTIVNDDVTATSLTDGTGTVSGTNGTTSTTTSTETINAAFKVKGVRANTGT